MKMPGYSQPSLTELRRTSRAGWQITLDAREYVLFAEDLLILITNSHYLNETILDAFALPPLKKLPNSIQLWLSGHKYALSLF